MIDEHLNYVYRFNFDAGIPITVATMTTSKIHRWPFYKMAADASPTHGRSLVLCHGGLKFGRFVVGGCGRGLPPPTNVIFNTF